MTPPCLDSLRLRGGSLAGLHRTLEVRSRSGLRRRLHIRVDREGLAIRNITDAGCKYEYQRNKVGISYESAPANAGPGFAASMVKLVA